MRPRAGRPGRACVALLLGALLAGAGCARSATPDPALAPEVPPGSGVAFGRVRVEGWRPTLLTGAPVQVELLEQATGRRSTHTLEEGGELFAVLPAGAHVLTSIWSGFQRLEQAEAPHEQGVGAFTVTAGHAVYLGTVLARIPTPGSRGQLTVADEFDEAMRLLQARHRSLAASGRVVKGLLARPGPPGSPSPVASAPAETRPAPVAPAPPGTRAAPAPAPVAPAPAEIRAAPTPAPPAAPPPPAGPGARGGVAPLQLAEGLLLVPVTLNRTQGTTLLVDTASSHTVLAPTVAARLGVGSSEGLPRRQVRLGGGQLVDVPLLRLASLQVGDAVVEDVQVGIHHQVPEVGGAEGVLGADILGRFTITVDRTARLLRLEVRP